MAEEVTPEQVARRWRLRGAEQSALSIDARTRGLPREETKRLLAHLGLVLAWADADEWSELDPEQFNRKLIARAIRHARKALADSAPATHEAFEPTDDTDVLTLCGLAEEPFAPGFDREELARLSAVASAPQERWLVRAFLEEGCTTLADVDRLYEWTHGQANAIAKRLRRKAERVA